MPLKIIKYQDIFTWDIRRDIQESVQTRNTNIVRIWDRSVVEFRYGVCMTKI